MLEMVRNDDVLSLLDAIVTNGQTFYNIP